MNSNKPSFEDSVSSDLYTLFKRNGLRAIEENGIKEIKVKNRICYSTEDNKQLTSILQHLQRNLLSKVPLNNSAFGFRKNRSYLDYLYQHIRGYHFLRLDIHDFFHSIKEDHIKDCLHSNIDDSDLLSDDLTSLVDFLTKLVTYTVPESSGTLSKNRTILPMGFITSPVISNIIFREADILIQKFCSEKGVTYSRYADDMLFSSGINSSFIFSRTFMNEIKYLISRYGFRINKKKTSMYRHTLSLNGYVIQSNNDPNKNGHLRFSNKKTKSIEKALHMLRNGSGIATTLKKAFGYEYRDINLKYSPNQPGVREKYLKDQLLNKLLGFRSFLISVLVFDRKKGCLNQVAYDKYQGLVGDLNKRINILNNT